MTVAVQYILTAARTLGSQDYYKKSQMTILGHAGVLFCENEQAHTKSYVSKKILTWVLREARGGLKETAGNRVQPDYHFIDIVSCSFLFLSTRVLGFPSRPCSKACQHILDIVGLIQA